MLSLLLLLLLLLHVVAVSIVAVESVTYTKFPDTDTHRGGAKAGACTDGSCQSLRCGVAKPCGKVGCAGAGPHPCNITALEQACTADSKCGGFNSDGWLKPCVRLGCGATHMHMDGVDTYASSRMSPPPPPPPIDPLPSIEDWHYPKEEATEQAELAMLDLWVTGLTCTSNITGTLDVRAANGSAARVSEAGEQIFGWQLRGFLTGDGNRTPLAVLRYEAQRWGLVAFVGEGSRLGLGGSPGSFVLRKGVGRVDAVRRPHYSLVGVDSDYFKKAVDDPADFIRQGMQHDSAFNETTFVAAASRLPPAHDYAIVGNVRSHTKFSVAQDGRIKLANFSIYSPTLEGNITDAGRDTHFGGGPLGTVLLFDPRLYLSWWPQHNFSDYKTSILGRYTRAVTLAAWDQSEQHGFGLTVVPNTRRGIETSPYDTSELLVELEEHGARPRYFAVRACVTASSNVLDSACDGTGCRDFHRCSAPADSTTVELTEPGKGAALFHANLLEHWSEWHNLFEDGGMQLELKYDASEAARVIDMARGTMAVAMTTWIGLRPNYGDGTNYWSVNSKDRGSLPLESYALDHALLLWGFVDAAGERIEWYLQNYVRGVDGMTPQSLSPGNNGTGSSMGPPGSLDLKHWEDAVFFADSFADYGRWVELWVDTARAKEASGDAAWIKRTWPQVRLMAQYMLSLRSNATTAGIGKGLIYGPAEHDTAHFEANWFSISGWTWRGFVQLQRFLADTGAISEPVLAAHLGSEASAFKKDLDASRDASLVRNAQGEPFFIPPFASANFTPYESMTQGGGFGGGASYSNFRYFSEMLSSEFLGPEIDSALNTFRETHGGTLSGMTRFRDHLDDMPANGYAYSAIATDRIPSFLSLMFGHIANYQAHGTFNAPEQLGLYGDGGARNVWTFSDSYRQMLGSTSTEVDIDTCVPSTTLVAFMLRWMLVWEERDADTVWLLKAAPRRLYQQDSNGYPAALAGGKQIQALLNITSAPTRFGDVSYSLGSVRAGQLQFVCNVTLVLHGRGFVDDRGVRLMVRLRDPDGKTSLQSATLSGSSDRQVAVTKVDSSAETVTVEVPRQLITASRITRVSFGIVAHFG